MINLKRLTGALLTVLLAGSLSTSPAGAAAVTVVVNGQTVAFDQPPIERAGRVFVPLRGVFERLGATVVYANGDINAQGNGRSVHLHIGSTAATVNGQTVYMDVAPFLVGARTLVPLRFVAQALGANVNWNGSNNTVYIQGSGAASTYIPPSNASFTLNNKRPATSTGTTYPSIHATFSEPVNRDTLKIAVDGQDVSSSTEASTTSFTVVPPFALNPGSHTVQVSGSTAAGASFNTGWTFTVRSGATSNILGGISPANGATVGSSFTLSGHTRPGAVVHIAATASATAFGIIPIGTGSFTTDVTADGNGNFSVPVNINTTPGGQVHVIVTSTTSSGSSVSRTLTYTAS
ncbi:MAG TPA: stalk domain-containing protein [Candidatus Rubrimentiphilum sp.]|nr:stalk domain-containing protein [Candidatus Rubrimentiphilum sp.]